MKIKIVVLLLIFICLISLGIPIYKKLSGKNTVNKLLQTYENIQKATELYQKENNCEDDIAKCISKAEGANEWDYMNTGKYFEGIAKHLDLADYACSNYADKDWLLSTPATLLDGSTQTEAWEAPSKAFQDSYKNANCYYLFKNGAVMHVQYPDNQKQSGFGTIDINGKKAPNRIGKDIFPVGWGAAGNPKHWAHKGFNPFWTEDGYASVNGDNSAINYNFNGVQIGPKYRGLCRISCPNCECNADISSPTYYVLENKKLPDIK